MTQVYVLRVGFYDDEVELAVFSAINSAFEYVEKNYPHLQKAAYGGGTHEYWSSRMGLDLKSNWAKIFIRELQ